VVDCCWGCEGVSSLCCCSALISERNRRCCSASLASTSPRCRRTRATLRRATHLAHAKAVHSALPASLRLCGLPRTRAPHVTAASRTRLTALQPQPDFSVVRRVHRCSCSCGSSGRQRARWPSTRPPPSPLPTGQQSSGCRAWWMLPRCAAAARRAGLAHGRSLCRTRHGKAQASCAASERTRSAACTIKYLSINIQVCLTGLLLV